MREEKAARAQAEEQAKKKAEVDRKEAEAKVGSWGSPSPLPLGVPLSPCTPMKGLPDQGESHVVSPSLRATWME